MENRILHDISVPVSDALLIWPGDPAVQVTRISRLEEGDTSTVSQVRMTTHSGTHIDAPSHFIPDAPGLEDISLQVLVGPAIIVDAGDAGSLSKNTLEGLSIPEGTDRLLFRTRNSERWSRAGGEEFFRDYVGITQDGARWLVSRGVRLVGVDYLSVAAYRENTATHRILLESGVVLLETINLRDISPGRYQLVCLPLKLIGSEAAPARAILIEGA